MKVQEKLDLFAKIAMDEAEEKRNQILSEVERDFRKAVDEAERQARKKANDKILSENNSLRQLKNKEVTAAANDIKKRLVEKRNALVEELFEGVEKRLEEFTKSEEYTNYLVKQIEPLLKQYENIEVRLSKRDMPLAKAIKSKTNVEVVEAGADFIGGLIVYIPQKRAIIDRSFQSRLEYEKSNFNLLKIKI